MTGRYDDEGRLLVRQPDGELLPVIEPEPEGPRPEYPPGQLCDEHGDLYGYRAGSCPACWSEIKAGDRPLRMLGRSTEHLA